MTHETINRILDIDGAAVRCQAATAQHAISAQDALAFAERVGEMLLWSLAGDLRQGQMAMLQIAMRRADREMVTAE